MKKYYLIVFILVGILLGLFLVFQFKTPKIIQSSFEIDEMDAKDLLIKSFLDEQSYLQSRIVALRKLVSEAQTEIEIKTENASIALLDNLKKDIGLTDVYGPGLDIILDDGSFSDRESSESSDLRLVQASDIRDIVNALHASSASAVSINNQRILATTAISSVGSNILVNNSHIAPPFQIKAIGDVQMLIAGLKNKNLMGDFLDRVSKYNLSFSITISSAISIPLYNGDLKTNYINLVNQ